MHAFRQHDAMEIRLQSFWVDSRQAGGQMRYLVPRSMLVEQLKCVCLMHAPWWHVPDRLSTLHRTDGTARPRL